MVEIDHIHPNVPAVKEMVITGIEYKNSLMLITDTMLSRNPAPHMIVKSCQCLIFSKKGI
ncbi:hypothetical protein [Hymenobacter sp. GOD-10R]|uniref:hypothetical protein n=1 Tax=Hymenobacter sp. GOD-10R TaxID=3093922 RepID=UPI002D79656B|nr:hypothetical protein [Hymenobacter sp. GOD-10R]WRQ27393.1 hypothetical protein SD425_20185 [Hymenobacter sp. GOD-10R]